jgi:serine protease Do
MDTGAPETVSATLWGADERTDTAVLKVDVNRDLPALSAESAAQVQVGEPILAAGAPLGMDRSVTAGIVSARRRTIPGDDDSGPHDVIQIDAAIAFGNSGGPVVNRRGRLVGMTVAVARPAGERDVSGYGFAVPAAALERVIPELIENRRARRADIGCTVTSLTPNLQDFFNAPHGGALITECVEGSPGAQAGLQADDVIVSMGGEAVRGPADLRLLLMARAPGEDVAVEAIRDGEHVTETVALGEMPGGGVDLPQTPASRGKDGVGLQVKSAGVLGPGTDGHRQGVAVVSVEPGSSADGVVGKGDVILKVDGTPVADADDYTGRLADAQASGRGYVVLHIHRRNPDGSTHTMVTDVRLPRDAGE